MSHIEAAIRQRYDEWNPNDDAPWFHADEVAELLNRIDCLLEENERLWEQRDVIADQLAENARVYFSDTARLRRIEETAREVLLACFVEKFGTENFLAAKRVPMGIGRLQIRAVRALRAALADQPAEEVTPIHTDP